MNEYNIFLPVCNDRAELFTSAGKRDNEIDKLGKQPILKMMHNTICQDNNLFTSTQWQGIGLHSCKQGRVREGKQ